MSRERDWVETVKLGLQADLARKHLTVATGHRLPYSLTIALCGPGGRGLVIHYPMGTPHSPSLSYHLRKAGAQTAGWEFVDPRE
jgi:hypothetical protein